jgi:hypothetical protein
MQIDADPDPAHHFDADPDADRGELAMLSDVSPTFDADVRDVVGEAAIQIPLHLQLELTAVLQQGLHLPPAASGPNDYKDTKP